MKTGLKKRILALACGACLLLGLAGCGEEAVNAYDIAVQNGFTGTEEEWLLSLHGANGADGQDLDAQDLYEAAIANGSFEGTFLDFCKALNIQAPQYNDTATIAENMLSCVSVYCGFPTRKTSASPSGYGYQGGSGVIVDINKEGGSAYILTNYHVVYSAESTPKGISEDIWVYLCGANEEFDGRENGERGDGIQATVWGGSMEYDIAILKIEGSEQLKNSQARKATLGDSESVKVGEETYVVGNPSLMGISVTDGVLSVQSEYIEIAALDGSNQTTVYRVMRTSAAINSGNSGGGMFNTRGELIGIVNAKSSSSTVDNMGYALPISQVKKVCANIRDNGVGYVKRATLGIEIDVKSSQAVLQGDTVQIEEVFAVGAIQVGTAAKPEPWSSGGLMVGDIFVSATLRGNTTTFHRYYELKDFLLDVRLNDTVTFVVERGGQKKTVEVAFNRAAYFTDFQ